MKQQHGGGHTRKHTSTRKHSGGGRKHNPGKHHPGHGKKGPKVSPGPLVVAQHPKHPKARKLARVGVVDQGGAQRGLLRLRPVSGGEAEPRQPPGAFPCCTAEAVAVSARLAGWPVGDADVLALHEACGGTRGRGVPIAVALEAAGRLGLAGVRPRGFGKYLLDHAPLPCGQLLGHVEGPDLGEVDHELGEGPVTGALVHGLILGADLPAGWYSPVPGPHALVLDGPGVWSWGEWHPWGCFPGAVVDEAWAVVWP